MCQILNCEAENTFQIVVDELGFCSNKDKEDPSDKMFQGKNMQYIALK